MNNFEVRVLWTALVLNGATMCTVEYRGKPKWFFFPKKEWRQVEFNGFRYWPETEAKYIARAILENGVIESGYSGYVTPACLIY